MGLLAYDRAVTSAYRRVFSVPGAVTFSAAGLVARMPMSMAGLGIVILVSSRSGSYSLAGAVAAVYIGANAVAAVPLARMVDRRGQGAVLPLAASTSAVGLALLIAAVELDWVLPFVFVSAAIAGATMPNIGAAVRARWSHNIEDRSLLDTAFAVEAVNDEVVFIVGPTLVTLLASLVHPLAGLATAGTAAVAGTWLFAAQRQTEPPRQRAASADHSIGALPWRGLAPLVVGAVMLGVLFGGTEVVVVAYADERGTPVVAGFLLALWAFGSLLSGVISGGLTFRRGAPQRYRWGVLALALLMSPLPFVDHVVALGAMLFLAGFAISPTMIAAVTWIEAIVPAARLNEGMVVFTTGLVAGVAPGAALVGIVVDAAGPSPAFLVPAAAGVVAAATAYAAAARSRSQGDSVVSAQRAG